MRCSLVLLVALVQQASADISANGKDGAQMQLPALPTKGTKDKSDARTLQAPAAAAAASYGAYATVTPTQLPWQKIAGPIAAGVIGTGALAGVIAVSVMKNQHSTTLAPAPPKLNAKLARAKEAPSTTTTTVAAGFASSGLTEKTTLAIACILVLVGICVAVGVCVMFLCNRKKRGRKAKGMVVPEEAEPMMATTDNRMDEAKQKWESELNASQYMQVDAPAMVVAPLVPAMTPSYSYAGSMPTMQNVVPMQTMPPPPPPPMQFAQSNYGVQQGYQPMYTQQASPLANTMSALPTTQFSVPPLVVQPPRFA